MESDRDRPILYALGRRWPWIAMVMAGMVVIAGVAVAIVLFSQTLTQHTVGAVLTADCTGTLVSNDPGSGVVLHRCSNAPTPNGAITVAAAGGTASWSHGGLAGYAKLKVVTSLSGVPSPVVTTDCDVTGSIDISSTSGSTPFPAATGGQEYVYCAEYTAPGTFGPITVQWSQ